MHDDFFIVLLLMEAGTVIPATSSQVFTLAIPAFSALSYFMDGITITYLITISYILNAIIYKRRVLDALEVSTRIAFIISKSAISDRAAL